MTAVPAKAAFLSWVRRGIVTRLAGTPATNELVKVNVTVTMGANSATAPLRLITPAEIIGFDSRAVSRVWPSNDATDGETNFFPLVEFHEADLPWRYTPVGGVSSDPTPPALPELDRLQPWLCLIVLEMEAGAEEGTYAPPASAKELGRVAINPNVPMPRLSQAWAWAHVQLSGADDSPNQVTSAKIATALATAPHTVVSRLLCPRRLDPLTHYTAFLVPAFKQAADAGLGVPTTAAVQDLAWPGGTSEAGLTLPVYYKWSFRMGDGGDFESLVRALKPTVLPSTIGLRDMDVSTPGGGLPAPTTGPLAVEGALKAPATSSTHWPEHDRAAFVSALSTMINGPADVVAPPIYGRWPASRHTVLPDTPLPFWRRHGAWAPKKPRGLAENDPPVWLQSLNHDPRTRVAAALGTQIVQKDQRQLLASAWQQVGAIRDINMLLRKAQLAREVSKKLFARYVVPLGDEAKLFLTKAVHGRVKQSGLTILDRTRNSPPRQALFSGAWRRLARPLGALGRRQGKPDKVPSPVISNVNTGKWKADAGPQPLTGAVTHNWLKSLSHRRGPVRFIPDRAITFENYANWTGPPLKGVIQNGPKLPTALAWDPIYDPRPTTWDLGGLQPPTDSPSMDRFRTAAFAFANDRDPTPVAGLTLQPLVIGQAANVITAALDPVTAIPAALTPRVVKAAGFVFSPADPIEPVMAYPEFPTPMSRPLAEISQDWILPGIADVPASSVSLAVTNTPFIEAYMVGLSHEMARELLWHEYPTDQRGTYFRQFWDPGGFVPRDETILEHSHEVEAMNEELRDITPIHSWARASALGSHKSADPLYVKPAQVVLLVRGELFRRYPGTTVYAVKAILVGTPPNEMLDIPENEEAEVPPPEGTHIFPVFSGRLAPDICFFGFDLSQRDAKGTFTVSDAGYFFCFQEQPGEPRFGLDAMASQARPAAWNAVAWPHLEDPNPPLWMKGGFRTRTRDPGPPTVTYIDLDDTEPDVRGIPTLPDEPVSDPARWHKPTGARGADLAYITYRRPFRILVHAMEMLP